MLNITPGPRVVPTTGGPSKYEIQIGEAGQKIRFDAPPPSSGVGPIQNISIGTAKKLPNGSAFNFKAVDKDLGVVAGGVITILANGSTQVRVESFAGKKIQNPDNVTLGKGASYSVADNSLPKERAPLTTIAVKDPRSMLDSLGIPSRIPTPAETKDSTPAERTVLEPRNYVPPQLNTLGVPKTATSVPTPSFDQKQAESVLNAVTPQALRGHSHQTYGAAMSSDNRPFTYGVFEKGNGQRVPCKLYVNEQKLVLAGQSAESSYTNISSIESSIASEHAAARAFGQTLGGGSPKPDVIFSGIDTEGRALVATRTSNTAHIFRRNKNQQWSNEPALTTTVPNGTLVTIPTSGESLLRPSGSTSGGIAASLHSSSRE